MESPPMPPNVAEVFASFPARPRQRLRALRALVFETARLHAEVGPLTEALKWGEPAYLTEKTKSGSTIRLGWKHATPANVYLFFNCNTDLVGTFRSLFGDELTFEGNRAVVIPLADAIPRAAVQECVRAALTYHVDRKKRRR